MAKDLSFQPVADATAVNSKGAQTLLANSVISFLLKKNSFY